MMLLENSPFNLHANGKKQGPQSYSAEKQNEANQIEGGFTDEFLSLSPNRHQNLKRNTLSVGNGKVFIIN